MRDIETVKKAVAFLEDVADREIKNGDEPNREYYFDIILDILDEIVWFETDKEEDKFKKKAQYYYKQCQYYGIECFYDEELEE